MERKGWICRSHLSVGVGTHKGIGPLHVNDLTYKGPILFYIILIPIKACNDYSSRLKNCSKLTKI